MKKVAAVIKHPGRNWEGDVRVDIVEVSEDWTTDEIRERLMAEMLGPFQVLFITEKVNYTRSLIKTP